MVLVNDARGRSIEQRDVLTSIAFPDRMVRFIGSTDAFVVLAPINWCPIEYTDVEDKYNDGLIRVKHRVWDRMGAWEKAEVEA